MVVAPAKVKLVEEIAPAPQARSSTKTLGLVDMLDAIGLPAWLYDALTLRIVEANQAAVDLYGFARSTFRMMTVLDVRPESERERFIAFMRDGSESDEMAVWRHRKANGAEFDVITSRRSLTLDEREIFLVVIIDSSEVANLRQNLQDTRFLFDAIIDALPTGVFLKDMTQDGRYVIYNSTVSEIVDRAPREVIGRTDAEAFGSQDAASFMAQDRGVMESGGQLVIEQEPVTRPNGQMRLIRTVKKPLPSLNGGKPRYLLGISEDVTERAENHARIAHMASHDFLTDLPNRLCFAERLGTLLRRQTSPLLVTLFFLDLDYFKAVNDTYGHQVGDLLLKQVGSRLQLCCQRSDMVARLGGDEFAILARIEGPDAALDMANCVRTSLEMPFDLGMCVVQVGTSIGIAFARDGAESEDVLMRHADSALYVAKSEGPGVAKIYDASMASIIETFVATSEELRRALDDGQFEIDYQPQFNAADNEVVGFEALLRWRHPVRGRVSPADFIPAAERNGTIVPIGNWILREACMEAARWPSPLMIAVNLSAVQFKQQLSLVRSVKDALDASGLAPERLELEITESVMLASSGANLSTLHHLRALGVHIAMDDFGTGYSSLSYLRSFPFDKIKLDRSFVSDLSDNPGSLAIVRAVTGLGKALAITTTAEGVETLEQAAILKSEGFSLLQGFLMGRPMAADAARTLAGTRQ